LRSSGINQVRPRNKYELMIDLRRFGEPRLRGKYLFLSRIKSGRLRDLVDYLHWRLGGYYSTSIGVDERPLDGYFHVYHVFVLEEYGVYVLVDLIADPGHPVVESITPVVPAANWAEREIMDFIGVKFRGHPEPHRLILPDDWPENVYPLRKDYPYDDKLPTSDKIAKLVRESSPATWEPEAHGDHTVIPVGPYHPALHEPEYFELFVEGEKIVDARYKGFMVHRGIEKIAESRLSYNQVSFIAERICGICGFTHSTAYCQAVEEAAGIDVPERAEYIRSILLEIERIHSHFLWMGVAFHLLGYDTGFMIMWRLRESIMDLAEELTGSRKMYGANIVGGIRDKWDIRDDKAALIKRMLDEIREEYLKYIPKIISLEEIKKRTRGVGVLSRSDARKYSVLGPHARASGIKTDVRKYRPYAAYKYVNVEIPVLDDGDIYARMIVRHEEILASIDLIHRLLDNIPKTPLHADTSYIPERRHGIGCTEAPRGEDLHFVITGRDNKLYRWRPRAPTYNNLLSVPAMLREEYLADAPIIIASIDPCFSCTDHVVVVDLRSGRRRPLRTRGVVGGR